MKKTRLYPTNVAERSSSTIYVDLEPISSSNLKENNYVNIYIESETMSASRIETNYKVEIFVAEKPSWLKIAFDDIETTPKEGSLYYYGGYPGDAYCMDWRGVQAKYSKTKVKSIVYKMSIDKVINKVEVGTGVVFLLPTRIKISHLKGGPTYIYDIVMHCQIEGDKPYVWYFTDPIL